jgi:hypothetical protein
MYPNGNGFPYGSATNRIFYGDGSGGFSTTQSNYLHMGMIPLATATSSVFGNASIYIPNYSLTSTKSYSVDTISENNAVATALTLQASSDTNTAAITSVQFDTSGGSFAQFTTFSLYGITKGSGGATVS